MSKARRLNIRQTVVKWADALPKTWKSSGGVPINKEWLDLFTVIQEGIDSGELAISSGTGGDNNTVITETISFEEYNPVYWCKLYGESEATVTTSLSAGLAVIEFDKPMLWMELKLRNINTVNSNLKVTIKGEGIIGNTSSSNINIPIVQKVDTSAILFNGPSENAPFRYDIDSSPTIDVVGVGTSSEPSITLRFSNIGSSFAYFNLLFSKM